MFTLTELEDAARLVHARVAPTPTHHWPLLAEALGTDLVVKHENHAPTGAFKVRGGVTFMDWLVREHPEMQGIVSATRGNHGQSQALAAASAGLRAKIVVPHGNSVEKNAAMRAYGAELIEHGADFDEARELAMSLAESEPLFPVPPFHRELVRGVATYGYEMFTAHPDLDIVYVPIGCGSGICGTIAARDALGVNCEIVGVVSEEAQAVKMSYETGQVQSTKSARTFADGIATRVGMEDALAVYGPGAACIETVSEMQIADAIRLYYSGAHQIAEGAGAAALACALKEKERVKGRKVGVILSGGNIDARHFLTLLQGGVPQPG